MSNGLILKLFDGGIVNLAGEKTYNLNFSSTEYDLSKFSPKTVTHQKIQETESSRIFLCLTNKYFKTNYKIDKFCEITYIEQFRMLGDRELKLIRIIPSTCPDEGQVLGLILEHPFKT